MNEPTFLQQLAERFSGLRPMMATAAAAYGVTTLEQMAVQAADTVEKARTAAEQAKILCEQQAARLEEQRQTLSDIERRIAEQREVLVQLERIICDAQQQQIERVFADSPDTAQAVADVLDGQ